MLNKVMYATVIYSCDNFDVFIMDYLKSVFDQTEQNFELLIITDGVDIKEVKNVVNEFNLNQKNIHYEQNLDNSSPIELRKRLVEISYELDVKFLIFSDFDDNVFNNRVQEITANLNNYDFVFNDFFIANSELNQLEEKSFFEMRNIPEEISDWHEIKSFNFVGFGSLAINLSSYDYKSLSFPGCIKALDWFIATKVLIDGGTGKKLSKTFANYRQHKDSLVGNNFLLTKKKLIQGLEVKENHYKYFSEYLDEFKHLYLSILKLKSFIDEVGEDAYIKNINTEFDTSKFCWWENIKLIDGKI